MGVVNDMVIMYHGGKSEWEGGRGCAQHSRTTHLNEDDNVH